MIEIPAGTSRPSPSRGSLRATVSKRDHGVQHQTQSSASTHDEPIWRRRARVARPASRWPRPPARSPAAARNLRRGDRRRPGRPPHGRGRLRKLRLSLVILGFAVLASVAWIFGIMMAVAQACRSWRTAPQYEAPELGREQIAPARSSRPHQKRGPHPDPVGRDRPGDEGGHRRDRGQRSSKRRGVDLLGYRPGGRRTSSPAPRPKAPRRYPAVRQERAAGPGSETLESSARRPSATTWSEGGRRRRSSPNI